MKSWNHVAIIGVGLIGGSIAAALRERGLAARVSGYGRNQANLETAKNIGAITDIATSMQQAVADADIVFVCTPVGIVAEQAIAIASLCPDRAVITDAASTKKSIVEAIDSAFTNNKTSASFVGGHPMAGSEQSGAVHSDPDLFERRRVILTKTDNTTDDALHAVTELWQSLGAKVCTMTPALHDEYVAAISHLPHLAAAALSATVDRPALEFAASGSRDTTRIAQGDPALWRQIMLENRDELLASLNQFETTLAAFRNALQSNDAEQLQSLLLKGKAHRDALGS